MVTHANTTLPWEMEAGGPEARGHPWLHVHVLVASQGLALSLIHLTLPGVFCTYPGVGVGASPTP